MNISVSLFSSVSAAVVFSSEKQSKLVTYKLILSGIEAGLSDLVLPMANFNATRYSGKSSRLLAYVPYSDVALNEINLRPDGNLFLYRDVTDENGIIVSVLVMEANINDVRFQNGGSGGTMTLIGTKIVTYTAPKTFTPSTVFDSHKDSDGDTVLKLTNELHINPADFFQIEGADYLINKVTHSAADLDEYTEIKGTPQ